MYSRRSHDIYIGNLDNNLTEQMIYNVFCAYGVISSVKIMRHYITHKSRGFGFVNFFNERNAVKAVKELNKKKILNNEIQVYLKSKYDSLERKANIFFSNLPEDFETNKMQTICEKFGSIFSIKRVENIEKKFTSFYVQFLETEDAAKALEELNNTKIEENTITCEIADKRNVIYIKGKNQEGVKKKIESILESTGKVILGDIRLSQTNEFYLLTAKLESEMKVKAFLQDFRANKDSYPLIKECVDNSQKKDILKDFGEEADNLFCRVFPLKDFDLEEIKQELEKNYGNLKIAKKHEKKRNNGSDYQLEMFFGASKELCNLVFDLESRQSTLLKYFKNNTDISYPNFLIKMLVSRKKRGKKQNNFNKFMNYNNNPKHHQQQQQMPSYPMNMNQNMYRNQNYNQNYNQQYMMNMNANYMMNMNQNMYRNPNYNPNFNPNYNNNRNYYNNNNNNTNFNPHYNNNANRTPNVNKYNNNNKPQQKTMSKEDFNSLVEVRKNLKEFLKLNDEEKNLILKNIIMEKLDSLENK